MRGVALVGAAGLRATLCAAAVRPLVAPAAQRRAAGAGDPQQYSQSPKAWRCAAASRSTRASAHRSGRGRPGGGLLGRHAHRRQLSSRAVRSTPRGARACPGGWAALLMALAVLLLTAPLAGCRARVLTASIVLAVMGVVEWRAFAEPGAIRARVSGDGAGRRADAVRSARRRWPPAWQASIALLLQRSANLHVARIGRVGDTEHYRNVDRHTVRAARPACWRCASTSLVFNAPSWSTVVDRHLAAPRHAPRGAADVARQRDRLQRAGGVARAARSASLAEQGIPPRSHQ